jgi:putative heme-binding domain-containing protein
VKPACVGVIKYRVFKQVVSAWLAALFRNTVADRAGTTPPQPPLHKGGKGFRHAFTSEALVPARAKALRTFILLAAIPWITPAARADDPPAPDSPLVKLLKSKRVPEARLGSIVDMIGKRGTAGDLDYIFQQAIGPDGFPAPIKVKALEALAEASSNRNLRPAKGLDGLIALMRPAEPRSGSSLEKTAVLLAGLWKLESAVEPLRSLAASLATDDTLRPLALDSLAAIGGQLGRSKIEALCGPELPLRVRIPAVASLAKLDVDVAAERAAEILAQPASPGPDLTPLLAAFLHHQRGADVLAAAISRHAPPADSAKLALRAVYALGRSDQALVAALSRAAGISSETKPLTPGELSQLVTLVTSQGDPGRGELMFRRADLNCMSCHALSKAGGEVGPDLSAIGQTSPADYIINSILDPDQSIKEQYHTLVVQTSEGQVFQGIVTDKDDQRIVLKEATGSPRVVPVTSIEDQKPGGSLMPKGLANLMTRAEFVDLVRFLAELGKPGPYAIRPTPTIQRWKVLKPVPESLSASLPGKDQLRDQVLEADPGRWLISYAKVAGSLPLDELTTQTGGKLLYVQGEIQVSSAGPIRVQLDSADGIRLWVDAELTPPGAHAQVADLTAGRHALTLRIDTAARKSREIKVEVTKPTGSPAEFTVVGGH